MQNLLQQIDGLDEKKEYQKIIDLIEILDENDQTYDIKSELGRAYNNLANNSENIEEQTEYLNAAVNIFKGLEEEEKRDKKLHYRLAYSYWSLGKYFDALESLDKSLSIDPEYDHAKEIYDHVIDSLSSPYHRYNTNERIEDFWKKFEQEEQKIREAVDNSNNENAIDLSNLTDDILKIVFEDPIFEIGFYTEKNKYEIIFPIDGNKFRIYVRQYLISKMPESLKENWIFTLGRRRMDNIDNLAMKRYETTITAGDIKIVPILTDDNKIDIEIYHNELSEISKKDQDQCFGIFFPLLDMAVGEIITIGYIGTIDFLEEEPEEETITLGQLYDYILKNLKNVTENITSYTVYNVKAREDTDEDGYINYREDIFIGTTSCMDIISAYYDNDTYILKELYQDTGAILGYFYFANDKLNKDEMLDIRVNIEDSIIEKASDFGVVIGGATGQSYCYIDFITYDFANFIEISQTILKTLDSDDIGLSVFYQQAIKYTL